MPEQCPAATHVRILTRADGSGRDFVGATGVVESVDVCAPPADPQPIYSVRVMVGDDSFIEYYRLGQLVALPELQQEGGAHA